MKRPISTFVVAALLFGSGFSALVYQTVWQRLFRLVFGATTGASAAVLAVFLGGLGLGGALLGARVERSRRPLEFYGTLEVVISAWAAVSPFIIDLLSYLYYALGGVSRMGGGFATLVRIMIATLVLGPAVFLMGGTLPAAARAVVTEQDAKRSNLAKLYGVNTLGAVAGAALSTFLLFEVFGTRLALWLACLINLLIGMFARVLGREAEDVVITEGAIDASQDENYAQAAHRTRFVYAAAFLVGFAFIALELIWYRMLAPLLGGSTFTFGLILAVALLGVGIGGYLYTRQISQPTWSEIGMTVALEAFMVAVPLLLGDSVALFADQTRGLAALGFSGLVTSWFLVASVVVLPAALVAGYQFPLLIALLGQGRTSVARHVGNAYACNTAGSVLGALSVGFVLLPSLGAVGLWRAIVVMLAALSIAALLLDIKASMIERLGRMAPAFVVALVAILFARAEGPTAFWRAGSIGAGRAKISNTDENGLTSYRNSVNASVIWERDGVESAVAMRVVNGLSFLVSGKSDGSSHGDRATQTLLGLLPAALHPAPKTAFVVGLGTGMTAGVLAELPGMQRVDVAELEPAILDIARAAKAVNRNVLEKQNVHIFRGDAREFMLTTDKQFDLIVSEPSNPYRSGVAALFTREFYRVVAEQLAPKGIFTQWIQGYEVTPESILGILRTLRAEFRVVELWQAQGQDLLILAGQEPRNYDAQRLQQRMATEPWNSTLIRMTYSQGAEGIFAHHLASSAFVEKLLKNEPPPENTDDQNALEYSFARSLGASTNTMIDLVTLATEHKATLPQISGPIDLARIEALRYRSMLVNNGHIWRIPNVTIPRQKIALEDACLEDARATIDLLGPDFTPRDPLERFTIALGYAVRADERAFALADALAQHGYQPEASYIRATLHLERGERPAAFTHAMQGIELLRKQPLPLCQTGTGLISIVEQASRESPQASQQAAQSLLKGPFPAYLSEDFRWRISELLAHRSGDAALCVRAFGHRPPEWTLEALDRRLDCFERAGDPRTEQARADLSRYARQTPGTFGLKPAGAAP